MYAAASAEQADSSSNASVLYLDLIQDFFYLFGL
jgi:hypothetical protein